MSPASHTATTRWKTPAPAATAAAVLGLACAPAAARAVEAGDAVADFEKNIEPVLVEYCFDCHADGVGKGDFAMDEWEDLAAHVGDRDHWMPVWKNLRSQMMPPSDKSQPSAEQVAAINAWIERAVFQLDPENPDPGRVTVRRLNRLEYRNTVRDLIGVDFDVYEAFPSDDTGYGFDNIGDVLSLSPLLMEKYLEAAEKIVAEAVHTGGPMVPTDHLWANSLKGADGESAPERLPLAEPSTAGRSFTNHHPGEYRITIDADTSGSPEATDQSAELALKIGGETVATHPLGWDNNDSIGFVAKAFLPEGESDLALELVPKQDPGEGQGSLNLRVRKIDLHGPLDGSHRVYPEGYDRIFSDGPPPPAENRDGRDAYARKILGKFATRAFRRPIEPGRLDRLVEIVHLIDGQPDRRFEHGIAQALVAVLASPRFLFRTETQPDPDDPSKVVDLDDYALASRLSYFLWSSMPDDRLFELAEKGELRANLRAEVDRMLADDKAEAFTGAFAGQWLQTRDVRGIPVDPRRVLRIRSRRDAERVFNGRTRRSMLEETERLFEHIVRDNRPLTDLIDPGYTFLDKRLAEFYGLGELADELGLEDDRFQKVALPADSVRGGILTAGSTLLVTSNPTRTSPVKRGLFVLDNILGTPAPPAPPDVPELRDVLRELGGDPTMRELMEVHREKPLCASCHARMDPIGLALENFNALGMWRDEERGKPIEGEGELITGERFSDVRDLKKTLVSSPGRRTDFYRCVTEKIMTYALGRGTEYYDSPTVDSIVRSLDDDGGHFLTLLYGVVESPAFLKRRGDG